MKRENVTLRLLTLNSLELGWTALKRAVNRINLQRIIPGVATRIDLLKHHQMALSELPIGMSIKLWHNRKTVQPGTAMTLDNFMILMAASQSCIKMGTLSPNPWDIFRGDLKSVF